MVKHSRVMFGLLRIKQLSRPCPSEQWWSKLGKSFVERGAVAQGRHKFQGGDSQVEIMYYCMCMSLTPTGVLLYTFS